MSERVELVWYGDDAPRYDHGPRHPLKPARVVLARELIHAYGVVDGSRVVETPARDATDEELGLVHTDRYIDAVKRAGRGEESMWSEFVTQPLDNPPFPRMHEAAARVAGASLVAAEAVLGGRAEHAFNPSGGLHHAMPDRASGFCVYDDPAIAIAWLLAGGFEKVAYVDVDVHHGDGPQAIFYRDPRVLTISLHQFGWPFFPGTGDVGELGAGAAEGTKVNVPLQPYTGDQDWLTAFREIVPPLVRAWSADVLVTQLGCDTHHSDPLAQLDLTTNAYLHTARELHSLAHEAAGGRWVATGGGGYQWARVAPRAWTIYFAEMAGVKVPDEIPRDWIERAEAEAGSPVPDRLSEEPVSAPSDGRSVAPVIDEIKRRVFPRHGLR